MKRNEKARGNEWPILRYALFALGAALVSACSLDTSGCSAILINGILAGVTDATTGAAVCDAELTATLASTGEAERLRENGNCTYTGTYDPGDYVLQVRRAGYADLTQAVHVPSTNGRCAQPDTVMVSVMLEPDGS